MVRVGGGGLWGGWFSGHVVAALTGLQLTVGEQVDVSQVMEEGLELLPLAALLPQKLQGRVTKGVGLRRGKCKAP